MVEARAVRLDVAEERTGIRDIALDCPRCECGGPMVGIALADWNHRAKPDDRLVCPACGAGRVGTDAEVAQATEADAEWGAR